MENVESVYDAWKAGVLDKFLAGENGTDHSSPAMLNVPTPVDWINMTRRVWSVYDRLDKQDKPIFVNYPQLKLRASVVFPPHLSCLQRCLIHRWL